MEVPFRGAGWVFLGELGSQSGLPYDSRRLEAEGQTFIFRAEVPGTYSLKFYKQDFIQDYILNDYVQVVVGEAPPGASIGGFSLPVDRGRVVLEPRWPSTGASAGTPTVSTATPSTATTSAGPISAGTVPSSTPTATPATVSPAKASPATASAATASSTTASPATASPATGGAGLSGTNGSTTGAGASAAGGSSVAPVPPVPALPSLPPVPAVGATVAGSSASGGAAAGSATVGANVAGTTVAGATVPGGPAAGVASGGAATAGASNAAPTIPPNALPEDYLSAAQKELDAGRVASALAVLDTFREKFPGGSDEAWWLYGKALETMGPNRDIKAALGFYQRLVAEYPQSPRYDGAQKRILYLQRYYFDIR